MSTASPTLRIQTFARGEACCFLLDDEPIAAFEGETIAAALWAVGIRSLRHSPQRKDPRGALCFMGSCQECKISVDGVLQEACRTRVRHGLQVHRIDHADPTR